MEEQSELMLTKTHLAGGGMVHLTEEECITLLAKVLSKRDLHLQACQGYTTTGTTVRLDMRTNIDSVVTDVKRSSEARDWALEYAKREGLLTVPQAWQIQFRPGSVDGG